MTFLDTGILVGVVLEKHPEHKQCLAAFAQYRDCFTDAHAMAEAFATLTGFYKVPVQSAAELTLTLRENVAIEALTIADYTTAISEAPRRGVMGGGIYDSLHATFARRKRVKRIVTRNPSHFAHVAPDVQILAP
jgi:predicted nucleic acid-binding protein